MKPFVIFDNLNNKQIGSFGKWLFVFLDLKVKQSHYRLGQALGFQEVEVPRFQENWHLKVVRLSTLRTGRFYLPSKYSWYSYLLEAESTAEP